MANGHIKQPSVILALVVLLTGGAPLVLQFLGVRFMPNAAMLQSLNPPVIPLSAILGFFVARALLRLEIRASRRRNGRFRILGLFVTFQALFFVTCYLAVTVTLPMIAALIGGGKATQYEIAANQSSGARRICSGPVSLAYPHFIFNMLCGVERPVREVVKKGARLRLDGYGSAAGIYYRTVSLQN